MKSELQRRLGLIALVTSPFTIPAKHAAALTLASPPRQYTREQSRAMTIDSFRAGRPLAIVIATTKHDVLTVRVLRVINGNLQPGIYLRLPHGVAIPTPGYVGLDEYRLAWLDKDVGWPQPIGRDDVIALIEAGLLADPSLLTYAP